jgi:hypothetical protein
MGMVYFCNSLIEYIMAILNAQQIKEINEQIAEIEKSIKPACEIGAHDKPSLTALLKGQNLKKEVVWFKCKREYSDDIVAHFIKEKGVVKNRFHKNNQSYIYILQ